MSAPATLTERVEAVRRRFAAHFGRPAAIVVRAPARVNLIGEHTDYNALPVLPMAIERCVLVAAAARNDQQMRLANADARFAPRAFSLQPAIRPFAAGDWGNYAKAAAQGLAAAPGGNALHGADVLFDSDVPPAAGLSSSSALVIGSALAVLAVNDRSLPPLPLAEMMAAAERYVGTHSGGMDQAVSLLAQAGCALRIDFDPLQTRPVPLPADPVVVVCNSLTEAPKSGAARAAYNQRVAECALACHILNRLLGTSVPRPLGHLGALRRLFPDRSLADFVALLGNALPPRPLYLDEIAARLGTPRAALLAAAGPTASAAATYAVVQRARHVLTEAERVDHAEAALGAGDWLGLSALMDASHASCRDDYEVSSPALEALIAAAKTSGAIAARLTGAGFGGCTINLVPRANLSLFQVMIERTYYQRHPAPRPAEHTFPVSPSAGASVMQV